jgi:hypothetical protein
VPRSITRTPLRRRPLRVAALFAAPAAAVALLSACSAGQISQTDKMVAAVPGANADSPHGVVSLRDVTIRYNSSKGYAAGATAPLAVFIVNNSLDTAVTLRGVSAAATAGGSGIGTVVLVGGAADIKANPGATPSGSASASVSASPSAPTGSAPPASGPASAPPSPSTASSANAALSLRIPPNSYARLAPEYGTYLAITGLTSALGPGSTAFLTFNVTGDEPFGAVVPFGVPSTALPRIEPSGAPAE